MRQKCAYRAFSLLLYTPFKRLPIGQNLWTFQTKVLKRTVPLRSYQRRHPVSSAVPSLSVNINNLVSHPIQLRITSLLTLPFFKHTIFFHFNFIHISTFSRVLLIISYLRSLFIPCKTNNHSLFFLCKHCFGRKGKKNICEILSTFSPELLNELKF